MSAAGSSGGGLFWAGRCQPGTCCDTVVAVAWGGHLTGGALDGPQYCVIKQSIALRIVERLCTAWHSTHGTQEQQAQPGGVSPCHSPPRCQAGCRRGGQQGPPGMPISPATSRNASTTMYSTAQQHTCWKARKAPCAATDSTQQGCTEKSHRPEFYTPALATGCVYTNCNRGIGAARTGAGQANLSKSVVMGQEPPSWGHPSLGKPHGRTRCQTHTAAGRARAPRASGPGQSRPLAPQTSRWCGSTPAHRLPGRGQAQQRQRQRWVGCPAAEWCRW